MPASEHRDHDASVARRCPGGTAPGRRRARGSSVVVTGRWSAVRVHTSNAASGRTSCVTRMIDAVMIRDLEWLVELGDARPRHRDGGCAGHQPADALPGPGPARGRARACGSSSGCRPGSSRRPTASWCSTRRATSSPATTSCAPRSPTGSTPTPASVRLAFLDSMATTLVPRLLRAFHAHAPGVKVVLSQEPAHDIRRDLDRGAVELGLTMERADDLGWLPGAARAAGRRGAADPPAQRPPSGSTSPSWPTTSWSPRRPGSATARSSRGCSPRPGSVPGSPSRAPTWPPSRASWPRASASPSCRRRSPVSRARSGSRSPRRAPAGRSASPGAPTGRSRHRRSASSTSCAAVGRGPRREAPGHDDPARWGRAGSTVGQAGSALARTEEQAAARRTRDRDGAGPPLEAGVDRQRLKPSR